GLRARDERHYRLERQHDPHRDRALRGRHRSGEGLRGHPDRGHPRLHGERDLRRAHLLHDLVAAHQGHPDPEHLMLRILHDTKIDFIGKWRWTTFFTLLFTLPGLFLIATKGYNYSIEFTGGTAMQVAFKTAPNPADIRGAIDAAGIHGEEISQFGA